MSKRATWGAIAVTAVLLVVAGGVVGMSRLIPEDNSATDNSATLTDTASSAPTSAAPAADGPLDVSGTGVGAQPFGTDADEVTVALAARFGEPDLTVGPRSYFRIPGHHGWYEDDDDPISPSWQYPVTSASCWGPFCVIFGGDEADTLQLRGWELSQYRRGSGSEEPQGGESPDVRLVETGLRLGDSWEQLHADYPETVPGGAEGASMAVQNTPWTGVSDGVAGWRLSGIWDYTHPHRAPAGAVVTRLSGGEGPQPGCC